MTVEEELEQFYGELRPDPDAERRIIAAVTSSRPAVSWWRPVLVAGLSAAAIAVTAVLIAVLRPHSPAPSVVPATHGSVAGAVVGIPPARANTVVGAVTNDGRPVVGARVYVQAWPNSETEDKAKTGQTMKLFSVGYATTDGDGSFTIPVHARAIPPRFLEGADTLNVEIDLVLTAGGQAMWNTPIELRDGQSQAMQIVFDVGRKTITVNGERSALPMG